MPDPAARLPLHTPVPLLPVARNASRHAASKLLLEAERYPALGQIIGSHFDIHPVTGENADAVFAHLAACVRQNLVIIVQLHTKHCIRQQFGNRA